MGAHAPTTPQQKRFRDSYVEHGDIERAFTEAGYSGSIKSAYRLLRAPWMADVRSVAISRVDKALAVGAAASALVERSSAALAPPTEIHPLETLAGRRRWFIDVMEGKIRFKKTDHYFTQDGERMSETTEEEFGEGARLKAAELLAKSFGDHTIKVDLKADVTATAAVPHYVFIDNGRSAKPLPVTSAISGTSDVAVCGTCGVVSDVGSTHVCTKGDAK